MTYEGELVVNLKTLVKEGTQITEIVFASLGDLRTAMRELGGGKSIICVFSDEGRQMKAEIISSTINSLIQDGKLKVSAITDVSEVQREIEKQER